ncbi:hypothetical protein AX774_g148 [Zancudomyces culisetae]|uniref:Uncharacterized protein n=1 Tax=Zancudomyces culisetae TaxID=1213189 RepID=A0A1R1PZA5_ZANCU|nr:hypothetical protein AX774_g148 [Zancudomyces culisetae]|eukprot:OMH86257.1 hypothetical protein AX774_g148 [Zancudomyces culisetae]
MEILVECTDYLRGHDKVTEMERLLSGTLMRMIPITVAAIRKALNKLIVAILVSVLPITTPSAWDMEKEMRNILKQDRKKAPEYLSTKKRVDLMAGPEDGDKLQKEAPIIQEGIQGDIQDKPDNGLRKINSFSSMEKRENVARYQESNKSMDLDQLPSGNTMPGYRNSVEIRSKDKFATEYAGTKQDNGWDLIKTLRLLSIHYVKYAASREEKAHISEIYALLFEKMGQEYIEAYYPIVLYHVLVDLVGETQVKHEVMGISKIETLKQCTYFEVDEVSEGRDKVREIEGETKAISLAMRRVGVWLITESMIRKMISQKAKLEMFKYLYEFWIEGAYNEGVIVFPAELLSNRVESQTGIALIGEKLGEVYEAIGIGIGGKQSSAGVVSGAGEVGLLVALEVWIYLANDLGELSGELDILTGENEENSFGSDGNGSDFKSKESWKYKSTDAG